MSAHRFIVAACIAALFVYSAFAQSTTGTITGLVSDSTGAVVPQASVTVKNQATGAQAETVSSNTGNYVIPNLPVGIYEISVSNPGFKRFVQSNISLKSNDNIRLDVRLEVGAVSEQVSVTAEAPPLKSESTEVSTVMEQKLVKDVPLPMNGVGGGMRNAFSVMMMLPQVKSNDGQNAWDDLQVGGGQQHDFNVSVDGLSVEMGWRNHVGYMNRLLPPVDAVEEIRIDTAVFKAEDSRASGGNFSLVTKSGTNEFHGTLFEYYQSQRLDANTWQNNKFGRPRAVYHRNDFGATGGGPVYIPKVYDGRNKTWFYLSYEGYRFPQTSGVSELTIPTTEMIDGDFSNWRLANGTLIPIYDPTTTRSDGQGGFIRDPFPGNIIPANRLSPLSRRIASYFPDPNRPGVLRNYVNTAPGPRKRIENAYLTKFDHAFGTKNRLAFTWTKNGYYWNNAYDTNPTDPQNWGGNALPYPLSGRQYYRGDQYYGNVFRLNDTHMITPTLINTITMGFHRLTHPEHDITAEGANENWGEILGGIQNNPYSNAAFPGVRFRTDNYYGWESTKFWDEYHNVWGFDENLSWVRASHSFKFGYSFQMMHLNRTDGNRRAGDIWFHRLETAAPGDNSGNSGSSFASFLLGAVDEGGFTIPNALMMRFPYHAFFVQDDWKITPRLTANLGLRYEMNMSVYEKHDRFSQFDPTLPNPAASGQPGALRFLGEGPGREGRRNLHDTAAGWGPRVGLAFQLTPSTVIRGGFGIFYSSLKVTGLGGGANTGFANSPSWASADAGITPAFYWDNGFPEWQAPPFINPGFNTGFSVPWFGADEIAKLPSSTNWNFAIQRALPKNFVVDLTYTGNKGTHLATDRVNYMQIHPQYAYLGSLLNAPIDDPRVVALGFRPPFENFKEVMKANATLGQSLRMFPQYQNVTTGGMMNHSGNSTYHAMIVKVTKRFSDGLSLLGTYTWSKLLTDADSSEPWIAGVVGSAVGAGAAQDHYNRRPEKSYGVLDLPHQFKVTASYDLPFGTGKRFFNSGIARWILGDWNLGAFVFYQSGFPMGVTDSAAQNFLRGGTPRPNVLTHDWRAPIVGEEFDPDKDVFYNRDAFQRRTDPRVDPFGNAPRLNGATRWFGTFRENATLTKMLPFSERVRGELRWEVYDIGNHKTWNRPVSPDLANLTQFGVVTGASGNRSMQLGLKLVF
jgi:hypothetical protein